MDLRRITDFDAPELDVYARLTENQLLNRADPQNALFVAESPLSSAGRWTPGANRCRF